MKAKMDNPHVLERLRSSYGAVLIDSQSCCRRGFSICYLSVVLRLSKMFGFDFDIFIWPDDFYWKSGTPEVCLCCRGRRNLRLRLSLEAVC
jgi:hypothetical protein